MELFCENNYQLLAVNYVCKKSIKSFYVEVNKEFFFFFAKIVAGYKPLTIFRKRSIIDL